MKVWIHEKTHGERVKHNCKPNFASGMATPTLLNVHIVITIYIPVSDRVCEDSSGSCTGMRSLDGAWEVSGTTASFVGVVYAVQ